MTLKQIHTIDFTPELSFQTARSGGAGGQNVNKVETKVILKFNVGQSSFFDDAQKLRISEKLKNQINQEGDLLIQSQESRSQLKNKATAIKKFKRLIYEALRTQKKRKPTRPSKSQKEARLSFKKAHSDKKAMRGKVDF